MEINLNFRYDVPAQSKAFHAIQKGARYVGYIGGIGSGKTFLGCTMGFHYALDNPGSRGMIVTPTYKMLKRIILPTIMEDTGLGDTIVHYHKADGIMRVYGNSTIFLASCDNPESLRGPNLAWFYLDEGALTVDSTWRILIGRLRQPGYRPWCLLGTTPKGKNWVWERWVNKPNLGYLLIRAKTVDNHHLDPDYVAHLRESYSGIYARQELEGGFETPEGLIYDEFDRDIHVVDSLPVGLECVAGVDWGYTNPTAIIVVGFGKDDEAYVIDEIYERRMTIDEIIKQARELDYPIRMWLCDPSEPAYIQAFNRAGLKARPAINDVLPGINEVKRRLIVKANGKPSLRIHSRCVNLISEMMSYCWQPGKEKPEKQNDHAVDALRYALSRRHKGRAPGRVGRAVTIG